MTCERPDCHRSEQETPLFQVDGNERGVEGGDVLEFEL